MSDVIPPAIHAALRGPFAMASVLAAVLALGGCGDSEAPSETGPASTSGDDDTDTTGSGQADSTGRWWGTTAGPGFPGGSSGGPAQDDDGEDEGTESFAEWVGEGTIEPGVSYDGLVELIVVDAGQEACMLTFTATDVTWLDTCAECQFALSYALADLEAETSEGCADVGIDPQSLEGSTHAVGLAGDALMREIDGSWQASGEAEHLMSESLFLYGFELE